MKKLLQLILVLLLVGALAAGAALLTRRLRPAPVAGNPQEAHLWIHQQLHISAAQDAALDPIETRYAEHRNQLTRAIRSANTELAEAILQEGAVTPRVNQAIEKIHAAQGELQMVTIAHVFEMKAALTPEQGTRLLQLTAAALKSEAGAGH